APDACATRRARRSARRSRRCGATWRRCSPTRRTARGCSRSPSAGASEASGRCSPSSSAPSERRTPLRHARRPRRPARCRSWRDGSGGLAAQARLDAVTQTLANVGTAGYKAGRPIFRLHPLDVSQLGLPEPPELRAAAQVTESETIRDFSQGPVRATGNPLDVAVAGEGFFVVATPRGERYTRQGSFGLDGEGYLVTEHGDRVQGDNGDLRIGTGDVAIGDDGQISVDGISGGRLKLVGFGEHPPLMAEG